MIESRPLSLPRMFVREFVACAIILSCVASLTYGKVDSNAQIDFSVEVQPILQKCASCHGGVKQTSGLSVLSRERLLTETDSGEPAVVPGDPDASELILRVTTTDVDLRMPPEEPLSKAEIDVLRRWIAADLPWPAHWSYEPPRKANEASAVKANASGHLVDQHIRSRLAEMEIAPSPRAGRTTLIRRLSLDLIGLLPTPAEVMAFVHDDRPDAYDRLVDRLLDSPQFGERWARHWLDEARYADSEGYEKDSPKNDAYLYRDWVIKAINEDMPFDEFTLRQLAGDLLRNATPEDLIATKFHLQAQFNLEGGVDSEEDRTKRVIDRVNTVGMTWLATTIGCCQCHDHPYDPISQRDFYAMYAFFNNMDLKADFLTERPEDAEEILAERAKLWDKISELLRKQLEDKSLSNSIQWRLDKLRNFDNSKGLTRFLREREDDRRTTYIFNRGDFLRPLTEEGKVLPNTPSILPELDREDSIANRIDLARWITDPDHPLTSRVTVNKVWMHLFGAPLAQADDFGTRGVGPIYKNLLDELAYWFAHDAVWSRKALIRKIVMSESYQQSSATRTDLVNIDPDNQLLARQNRFRVEAEVLRDIALQAAGLLSTNKIGGPSVFPPLPAIVAEQTFAGGFKFKTSEGEDRYRRGLYTFCRRTAIDPNLLTFDCPDASVSRPERFRSNNALQALATLQNEVFHEAAQAFAMRLLKARRARELDEQGTLEHAFMIALGRSADADELATMTELLESARSYYQDSQADAKLLVGSKRAAGVNVVENAAWVATARIVLNFDEFLTRE